MDRVESFVISRMKGCYDTDLKDEIVSNINERISDYIANGMTNDEAFVRATNDVGDLRALAQEQSMMWVDKGKADFIFSIYAYILMGIDMLLFYFASQIKISGIEIPSIQLNLILIFMGVFIIYPLSCFIEMKKSTEKKQISRNLRGQIRNGIIGAILISIIVIILNYMTSKAVLWCVFPIIGVMNWPIGIAIHKKVYKDTNV
jgi:hypothetical protein